MAVKRVTYKEPSSYFNAAMLKAAEDYDKKQAKANATQKKTGNNTKKK